MEDRFDEVLAEMRKERAEWSARMDRRDAETDDLLRFLGELNRRGEIALQDLLRGTAAMRAEIRESIKEMRVMRGEVRANIAATNAITESVKAHTRAIFALIDRLEGGGPLAPAS